MILFKYDEDDEKQKMWIKAKSANRKTQTKETFWQKQMCSFAGWLENISWFRKIEKKIHWIFTGIWPEKNEEKKICEEKSIKFKECNQMPTKIIEYFNFYRRIYEQINAKCYKF